MKHGIEERAEKILEMAMPLIDKMIDDTDDAYPEKALDACTKLVELAHYLYEICDMKNQPMDYEEKAANNPKRGY